MKTSYGLYCMYDADLCAFMPGTLSVFLTDELAVQALAVALSNMKEDERAVWSHRRFYKVGDFDVATMPEKAKELTAEVSTLLQGLLSKECKVDEVSDKI